jgi:hypothetical protein
VVGVAGGRHPERLQQRQCQWRQPQHNA